MKRYFAILYMTIIFMVPDPCMGISLSDLEKQTGQSIDTMILSSEIDREYAVRQKTVSENGIKLSGNAAFGWNREPVSLTQQDMIDYEKLYGQISLIFPLFGSYWQEQAGVLKSEKDILTKKYAMEIHLKTATATLRKEYINLWISGKKLEFVREFLNDETFVTKVLKERIRPGILLKSDFQEFMTAYGRMKREEIILKTAMERASDQIISLTGFSSPFSEPEIPDLPEPVMDEETFKINVQTLNPELAILEQITRKNSDIRDKTKWSMIESHVDLSYATSRTFPGTYANGTSVSLNVRAPLNFMTSNRLSERTADLEIKKSRMAADKIRNGIKDDYRAFKAAYLTSLENLSFADQRLTTAYENVRETRLRLQFLRGDVFEKFVQARYAYFNAAIDAFDAEAITMKACADLLATAGDKTLKDQPRPINPEKLPGSPLRKRLTSSSAVFSFLTDMGNSDPLHPDIQTKKKTSGFGVYVWDSFQIMTKPTPRFWQFLEQYDVTRLLISFDGKTIRQFRQGKHIKSLKRLIKQAGDRGIIVELLLGEPSWIYPDKRNDLLSIIDIFKTVEFSGLHLDIEPDQLDIPDDKTRETLKSYLIDTLKDVQAVSTWPISISMHPRYFEETGQGRCMGCELEAMGISEVSLMVYMSNTDKVVEKVKPIMTSYPLLTFSVAQSIEPDLPVQESHYSKTGQTFLEDMKKLDRSLECRNYNSVIFQSLKDLIKVTRK